MSPIIANKLEGVVGKHLDSAYIVGLSNDWVKLRTSTAKEQTRR